MKDEKTNIQKDNEIKKVYLNSYRTTVLSIQRLQELRRDNFINKTCPSVQYSEIIHINNKSDLSDFAVKIDDIDNKINSLQNKRLKILEDILTNIESLENETERAILDYRYIRGYTWEKIATKIKYSYRHTLLMHGKALEHFKL